MPPHFQDHDRPDRPGGDDSLHRPRGVLIVDEMALVLVQMKSELQQMGCAVWLASDGPEALTFFKMNLVKVDLVILQVEMGAFEGFRTLSAFREIQPNLRCCLTTIDGDKSTNANLRTLGVELILRRPLIPVAASHAIWKVIHSPPVVLTRRRPDDLERSIQITKFGNKEQK